MTSGQTFRSLLQTEKPLQIVGAVNALCAMMAEKAGFKALYLSGAGVAGVSYGLPDLAVTSLDNVLEDARRLLDVTDLPLLVDIDTGWGGALNIARTIQQMECAGVAAVHIEDQVFHKRCGHRPGKSLISKGEMVDRIKAAVDARRDPSFVIMARTDAMASEPLEEVIARATAYVKAGADMLFAEAITDLSVYGCLAEATKVPILANITEFGKTPLWTVQQLKEASVSMVLYPLSAARAMMKAAENVYKTIRMDGTQRGSIPLMQTREELYTLLGYHALEAKLDKLYPEDVHA